MYFNVPVNFIYYQVHRKKSSYAWFLQPKAVPKTFFYLGMPQIFHMDIFDAGNSHLLSNVTSMIPFFVVSGLRPGQAVRLLVYAANRKGGSERIIMEAQTIQEAEKRTGKGKLILRITSS